MFKIIILIEKILVISRYFFILKKKADLTDSVYQ